MTADPRCGHSCAEIALSTLLHTYIPEIVHENNNATKVESTLYILNECVFLAGLCEVSLRYNLFFLSHCEVFQCTRIYKMLSLRCTEFACVCF